MFRIGKVIEMEDIIAAYLKISTPKLREQFARAEIKLDEDVFPQNLELDKYK